MQLSFYSVYTIAMKDIIVKNSLALALIIIITLMRFFHPFGYNFSPLTAICLFGGAYLTNRNIALILPVLMVWITDLIITNTLYAQPEQGFVWFYSGCWWQYGTYALIAAASFFILKNRVNTTSVLVGSLASSIGFFLLTNFGYWVGSLLPKSGAGLAQAYAQGLPFFQNQVVGDLIFNTILFGTAAYLSPKFIGPREI